LIGCVSVDPGDKPVYHCELCPTTCGRKTDLRLHVQKLHTSEKPMNCKLCDKTFPDRWVGGDSVLDPHHVDADPDSTDHPDADLDPDPSFQINAHPLDKVLIQADIPYILA
jgi:hypothetical protein